MTTEEVSFNFCVGWCKPTRWHSSNIGRHHEQVPRIIWVRYGKEHGWFLLDFFTEKLQEEKKDTFVEKLATQVIKNLQVKISSIHIRYEDDVSIDKTQVSSFRFKSQRVLLDLLSCHCSMFQLSDPLHPICVGLTLSEMSLQVKPGSRTRTPLHMHALNFIVVLCFRPLMKTGKRASWMKLPRSFIRWWSVSQPISCTFTLHFLLVRFSVWIFLYLKRCILSFYLTTNVYIYCSDIMAIFSKTL